MSKHSPTPWRVLPSGRSAAEIVKEWSANPVGGPPVVACVGRTGHVVARLPYHCEGPGETDEEITSRIHANARLIVAAPNLLASLRRMVAQAKQAIEDIGGCDHSVGICCCHEIGEIELAERDIALAEGR